MSDPLAYEAHEASTREIMNAALGGRRTSRALAKCKQCGWQWFPRSEKPPKNCPNAACRSTLWNVWSKGTGTGRRKGADRGTGNTKRC
jgi:hypothetical protein